jgi:glycogen synthase
MRILIVSNLYPPHYVGGYELRCSQVAQYLHEVGHQVRVLTSSTRIPAAGNGSSMELEENVSPFPVERSLHYHPFYPEPMGRDFLMVMAKKNLRDTIRFLKIVNEFRPDIVNWWNLEGITKTLLPLPAAHHIPDVHWVEDNWMIREYGIRGEKESLLWFEFWRGNWDPWIYRPIADKTLARCEKWVQGKGIPTRPFPNCPRHVCFVSEFMRLQHLEAGFIFPSSEVIYGGIKAERFFAPRTIADFESERLRLLYAGYVEPNRRLHIIIEALGLLPQELRDRVELSIAQTDPPQPGEYVQQVKRRVETLGLSNIVNSLGKVRHEEMPRVYREHHVLVSATTRPEGLPMTMMEAMFAGCAVITTGSGGAIEIADRADLPIFPQDHPIALSRLIAKLAQHRNLVYEIGRRGQEVAVRDFSFTQMAQRICESFQMLRERQTKAHEVLA